MGIKSNISGWLRQMNLLSAAERTRYYFQRLKYKKDNDAFKKEFPGFALPPDFFIYETYRLNYRWYYEDGKNTANEIVTLLSKYFDCSGPGRKVLDWGCGPGRIVRHLPGLLPAAGIYGTDYNNDYIEWCRGNLKGINFSVNKIDPPANFDDSCFDAVIGLSVFTHLSEKNHVNWITELFRIVKPGGGVLITTQGEGYYSKLTPTERRLFDAGKPVTRYYLNEGNRLYTSFQPAGFMKKLIIGKFKLLKHIPGNVVNNEPKQDTWLLEKL